MMLDTVLEPFRRFMRDPRPDAADALPQLRLLFVLSFGGQLVVAALVALLMRLVAGAPSGDATLVARVLLGLSLFQGMPLLFVVSSSAQGGGRAAALAATIATGVLFSAPGWFAAFAWLVGSPLVYLIGLAGVLMVYYALGLLLVGRYAGWLEPSPPPEPEPPTQQPTS